MMSDHEFVYVAKVPGDGNCALYSVIVGFFNDVLDDEEAFRDRASRMFGVLVKDRTRTALRHLLIAYVTAGYDCTVLQKEGELTNKTLAQCGRALRARAIDMMDELRFVLCRCSPFARRVRTRSLCPQHSTTMAQQNVLAGNAATAAP